MQQARNLKKATPHAALNVILKRAATPAKKSSIDPPKNAREHRETPVLPHGNYFAVLLAFLKKPKPMLRTVVPRKNVSSWLAVIMSQTKPTAEVMVVPAVDTILARVTAS